MMFIIKCFLVGAVPGAFLPTLHRRSIGTGDRLEAYATLSAVLTRSSVIFHRMGANYHHPQTGKVSFCNS